MVCWSTAFLQSKSSLTGWVIHRHLWSSEDESYVSDDLYIKVICGFDYDYNL